MNMNSALMYVSVSGSRLWSCPDLFPALKGLIEKGLCRLHICLHCLTCTAAIKSNHTQRKSACQAGPSSTTRPPLTLMSKRFKSADSKALTQHEMDIWAKPRSARESRLKKENPAAQQTRRHPSLSLSLSLSLSQHIPILYLQKAAGWDTFNGHELKLG